MTSTPCRRFAEYFTEPLLASGIPEDLLVSSMKVYQKRYTEEAKEDDARIGQVEISMSKRNHPHNHLHHGESFTAYITNSLFTTIVQLNKVLKQMSMVSVLI